MELTQSWYLDTITKLKRQNIRYAAYLSELRFYKSAQRARICSSTIAFDKNHQRLKQTWYCKDRLCPICAWKRSWQDQKELQKIITTIYQKRTGKRFLFLTLTVKNVSRDALQETLRKMGRSISTMFQRKLIKDAVSGYIRTTEITTNHLRPEAPFHPHMHLLLLVSPEYFSKKSDVYIKRSVWQAYWQRTMKIDYLPEVYVEPIKANSKRKKSAILSSILEISKYQVKSTDYMTNNHAQNLTTIRALKEGLQGSRHISYSGEFKNVRQKLIKSHTKPLEPDILNLYLDSVEWDSKKGRYQLVSGAPFRPYMLK